MNHLLRLLLAGLGLAVSCEATQAPASAEVGLPLAEEVPSVPLPTQLGYHRYQGMLGGRPVVVELTVTPSPPPAGHIDCSGRYYFTSSGASQSLSNDVLFRPNQPLELRVTCEDYESEQLAGRWCAEQPLGPSLSGTFTTSSFRPPEPFRLHESYEGAVRYHILREELRDRVGQNYFGEPDTSIVAMEYLHLLGGDTLRPALARLQCPVPARRLRARQARAAEMTPTNQDLAAEYNQYIVVTLNENDLLSYYEGIEESVIGSHHGGYGGRHLLYDLRTGQALNALAQLQPGSLQVVRRLLTRQAQRDTATYVLERYSEGGLLMEPEEGFTITPAGWEAEYNITPEEDPRNGFKGKVSWAELGPLLRPGSPLLRVVRVRSEQVGAAVHRR